jgi:hypothetical protein
MELGSPWDGAIFILIQFQKPFCPFSLGSAKKTINSLKIHKPKKRKKKKRKRQGNKQKRKRKELGKVQEKSKRKANYTVESCIGSFWLITLGFLEIESS